MSLSGSSSLSVKKMDSIAGVPKGVKFVEEDIEKTATTSAPSNFGKRRESMATKAYHQALINKEYSAKGEKEMAELRSDNRDLENFVNNKSNFIESFNFKLDAFSNRLREVIATKKAANKLLGIIGKKRNFGFKFTKEEEHLLHGPSIMQKLGPSAILEHARNSRSVQCEEIVGEAFRSKLIPGDNRVMIPSCGRARRVKEIRNGIDDMHRTGELPKLKNRPTTALSTWEKVTKTSKETCRITKTIPSRVLVVTGPVDYNKLLTQQRNLQEELDAKHSNYVKMMSAYDSIQNRIQRRFSMLLKTPLSSDAMECVNAAFDAEKELNELPPI